MDSVRFKQIREALNLSQDELYAIVGIDSHVGSQVIVGIEEGTTPIPRTLAMLMELIGTSVCQKDNSIPEYLLCSDLSGNASNSDLNRIIIRTRYPRCYVSLSKSNINAQWTVQIRKWIDPVVNNRQQMIDVVTESAMSWLYRASESLAGNANNEKMNKQVSAHAQNSLH